MSPERARPLEQMKSLRCKGEFEAFEEEQRAPSHQVYLFLRCKGPGKPLPLYPFPAFN